MKQIYFTVTNDLTYDQRMQRICTTLSENGYKVTLVGRRLPGSLPLARQPYCQKRIRCLFNKGKWFYAEYNFRLFFSLLFKKMDAICAIDLDTILPCLHISRWKRIQRVYDAHEFFTELKEVRSRPAVHRAWMRIERKAVPKFKWGYTVSEGLSEEFKRRYGVQYQTIRNVPVLYPLVNQPKPETFILYQGAVNEARGFEFLIPAMNKINARLVVCGDGNFMKQLKELIKTYDLHDRVELRGMLTPDQLRVVAQQATVGIALAEREGLNQWLALPNKFLDYIHAGLPQLSMNYPEYRKINDQFEVALLIDDLVPETIAKNINNLLGNTVLYRRLRENCLAARNVINWQQEEKKLLDFYQSVFA